MLPVQRRCLAAAGLTSGAVLVLAGCGGNQNALQARSGAEHSIVELWWVMLGGAAIGFAVVMAFLFAGWWRRRRPELPGGRGERAATAIVVSLGVVVPVVVLTLLFVWADVFVLRSTAAPSPRSTAMTIDVIGHDWWWEVRYPGTKAVTANEIHIPVDTRVQVVGTTADVIHSFWVPELNRKIDLIPGRHNRLLLEASRAGVYRGQCSEFCGLQHAHMAVIVVAEGAAAFHRWLADMERPARSAAGAAARGRQVFLNESCADCHAIRGTSARGDVGPDLTHLATRLELGAATIPNRHDYLRGWIEDPQAVKPGALMPAVPLTRRQLDDVTAYLETLR
jgi:cytochrome c oxidase subunit 2